MKKYSTFSLLAIVSLLACLSTGCKKNNCHNTYTYSYYIPVYETKQQVQANIKSNPGKDIENPGKLFIFGNYLFINEIDKGIHILDNSNPAAPLNVAFIDIPGNMDLAVKDNILYADAYSDLVTIDISNPLNVVVKKYNEGVFPFRGYENGFIVNQGMMVVDWIKKDTTVTEPCESQDQFMVDDPAVFYLSKPMLNSNSSRGSVSPVGLGGSMARFALVNDYLYTVSTDELNIFDVSNSIDPTYSGHFMVDYHVETIYPFENKLFIGSNNGMFIYDIEATPKYPEKVGEFTHARACDPVIADNNFAYVTLHSETNCLGYNNELDVVKLNNLVDATLAKTYNLASPHGLSKDGNLLFLCDGTAGLKIFDATDPLNLQPVKEFPNLETYDVIAYNKIAIVVAKDGLYQYDYSDVNNIHLVSKTGIFR